MDANRSAGRVTNSAGDVDRNGDVVDELGAVVRRLANAGPLECRFLERPGFDERIAQAGGDPETLRRMLGART